MTLCTLILYSEAVLSDNISLCGHSLGFAEEKASNESAPWSKTSFLSIAILSKVHIQDQYYYIIICILSHSLAGFSLTQEWAKLNDIERSVCLVFSQILFGSANSGQIAESTGIYTTTH